MFLFKKRDDGRFIVAGLGNPGKEYDGSRHNIGFLALDYFCKKHGIEAKRAKFQSLCAEGSIDGTKYIAMKPTTYMNLSGNAVGRAADFYKIPPERIIILCDDISIPAGSIRIRAKGSSGGHNGLKSIGASISSNDYPRIRIGVGDREAGDLADWVLEKPSKQQLNLITARFDDIAAAIELIMKDQLLLAQSRYNR